MSLVEQLSQDLKTAMKAKDKEKLAVVRTLKAALQNEALKEGTQKVLTADEELTVVSREMKQRKESLQEFEQAGRTELVAKAQQDIEILAAYLPAQLSEAELRQIVAKAIEKTGATAPNEFGKVMGVVMPQVKGKADGNQVNALVKAALNN